MKPTKNNLKEEIEYRIQLLSHKITPELKDENKILFWILANEHAMNLELLDLVETFENRMGYEKFQAENYTPLKCYETKEPLKIGDKVKSSSSDANGILKFDDYTNRYVISNEFGQHTKPSNFIKIKENFDYKIDTTKVECRNRPYRER